MANVLIHMQENDSKNDLRDLLVLLIFCEMLLFVLLPITCLFCIVCNAKRRGRQQGEVSDSPPASEVPQSQGIRVPISLSPSSVLLPAMTNLNAEDIDVMKSYCNQARLVGEGSFAEVYKGNLKGKDVAIKKLKDKDSNIRKFVENEVRLLRDVKHKNINTLVAWCIEESTYYMVYEFVNGCTLDQYLRENTVGSSLSWSQCLRLIMSIAEGVQFLHLSKIIHGDIKPQNLMVDVDLNQIKIVDFGFCRSVDWQGTHRSTERIVGTRGYWAPEYCLFLKLSSKHDVYSFGIVVLEMITGQRHVDDARGSSLFHIPDYVQHVVNHNGFEEAMKERINETTWEACDIASVFEVVNLALQCADKEKGRRPSMDDAVKILSTVIDNLETTGEEGWSQP